MLHHHTLLSEPCPLWPQSRRQFIPLSAAPQGTEKTCELQRLRFSMLAYLQFIKCSWPGFEELAVCSPSHCSTKGSVICLVALLTRKETQRGGLGPHCLCPQSTIADHFWGVTLITSDYMPARVYGRYFR